EFLARVRAAVEAAGVWEEFSTDWLCLDCELMPWSAKAHDLLIRQYAAVGAAARASLDDAVSALEAAARCGLDIAPVLASYQTRRETAGLYVDAYRRYCWPVSSITDLKLAPFHLLATQGAVHTSRDHGWHMEKLARICRED